MKKTTVSTFSRKALAVFMSIVLVVGLMPLPAFADLVPGEVDLDSEADLVVASTKDLTPGEGVGIEGDRGAEVAGGELTAMALGDHVTVGNVDYYYTTETGQGANTVAITAIETTVDTDIVIPQKLTIPVGDGSITQVMDVVAFKGNNGGYYASVVGTLNSLTIPASVTSMVPLESALYAGTNNKIRSIIFEEGSKLDIPENAFNRVEGLRSITLPVGSIGKNAFYSEYGYLGSLSSVTWPSDDETDVTLGEGAFQGCTGLTSITLPNNLTTIGASAFKGSGLTSIEIPNSVTEIGVSAFEGVSLSGGVTLGSGVQTIGTDAFKGGSLQASICLPA